LQDRAWNMFNAINAAAKTEIAYASIVDVTAETPELFDSMESFWTAETLKYFYLIFAEPDVVSLDDYVL
jgi:mannosyl-oligosaccharide alpha-1,2-mannosidase